MSVSSSARIWEKVLVHPHFAKGCTTAVSTALMSLHDCRIWGRRSSHATQSSEVEESRARSEKLSSASGFSSTIKKKVLFTRNKIFGKRSTKKNGLSVFPNHAYPMTRRGDQMVVPYDAPARPNGCATKEPDDNGLFWGKMMVFLGDFRHIPPVVLSADTAVVTLHSIRSSPWWNEIDVLHWKWRSRHSCVGMAQLTQLQDFMWTTLVAMPRQLSHFKRRSCVGTPPVGSYCSHRVHTSVKVVRK